MGISRASLPMRVPGTTALSSTACDAAGDAIASRRKSTAVCFMRSPPSAYPWGDDSSGNWQDAEGGDADPRCTKKPRPRSRAAPRGRERAGSAARREVRPGDAERNPFEFPRDGDARKTADADDLQRRSPDDSFGRYLLEEVDHHVEDAGPLRAPRLVREITHQPPVPPRTGGHNRQRRAARRWGGPGEGSVNIHPAAGYRRRHPGRIEAAVAADEQNVLRCGGSACRLGALRAPDGETDKMVVDLPRRLGLGGTLHGLDEAGKRSQGDRPHAGLPQKRSPIDLFHR